MTFFNVYGTVSNEYFSKYNIAPSNINIIVGAAQVAGILGSLIISSIVDKTLEYRKYFLILNTLALISQILLTILPEIFPDDAFIIIAVLYIFLCFCIIPIYSISMDLVCELTYPVGESISGGIIMTSCQITGIIFVNIIFLMPLFRF